jgi:exodeoxyribonuclease V gamma subunit
MAGQITVCSMVPMRSIPFKVVAILGLNDGQFPRSRPPLGFDLMAQDKPRLGDRSRRGDDRYLFLEALLSARNSLYLSYQGFDIHKNEQRPPSLVLEELFDYLSRAYGFDKESDVRTLPLQPFSQRNYEGRFPSFDARWANINQSRQSPFQPLTALVDIKSEWHLTEWINFLTHPSKYFAQQRLGLFLGYDNRDALEDTEPFDLTHLDRYQIQSLTITELLEQGEHSSLVKQQLATSAWPVNNQVAEQVTQWQADASEFTNILKQLGAGQIENNHHILELGNVEITADLPLNAKGELLRWRLANPKGKDVIDLWLHHLMANSIKPTSTVGLFRGPKETYSVIRCEPVTHAKNILEQIYRLLLEGLSEPLFLNADLLISLLNGKDDEASFNKMWDDTYNQRGLKYDDYVQYFWQQCPDYELTMSRLQSFYEPLLAHCVVSTWESDDE